MSDLAIRHDTPAPTRASWLPSRDEYGFLMQVAEHLANTEFVPKGVRGKAPAVLACMLTGREMGIGPMRALRQIDVIEGKPSPSPELLMARVLEEGHYIRVSVTNKERCVVRTRRKDWPDDEPTFELEWTMEDAKEAKLDRKQNWNTYRRAMLRSRCVSETVRAVHPDISEGASYSPEELTQGEVYDPAQGQVVLDGLPDDLREQVEVAMEPVHGVIERAERLRDDGVISAEQCTAAIAHARNGPRYVDAVKAKLDKYEAAAVDGEVVDAVPIDSVDAERATTEEVDS